jgi:hypothetical protein
VRIRERVEFSPMQKRNESECPEGCRCTGAVVSCPTENGKEMIIEAGRSGNIITLTTIQDGNETEVETSLELVSEMNRERNKTMLKTQLSNGRNAEIKIMPEVASETALARLRLRVCNETRNCSIELKEVGRGEGNQTRLAYEVQTERHFRILGMFRTKAQVRAQVDAENGEILQVKKPWWAFLASEPEETEDSEED